MCDIKQRCRKIWNESKKKPHEPQVVAVHRVELERVDQVQHNPEILAEAQPVGVVIEEQEHGEVQEVIPQDQDQPEQNLPQAQPVARRLRVVPGRQAVVRLLHGDSFV